MAGVFSDILAEEGVSEPAAEILKRMKGTMGEALGYYQRRFGLSEKLLERYSDRRREAELRLCAPFPGVVEVCRRVNSSGGANYLYTHRGESAIELMKKFGLYGYFSDLVTSERHFARKPSPDAIDFLVKKHGLSREETIMIGDRDLDMQAAKNAGIYACFFSDGQIVSGIADYRIEEIPELYPIIGLETRTS
jgi:phosphoglycolate phosphatase-like HAD superfamily hydrolase